MSQTSEAADRKCGPITLDQVYPGVDVHGNPTTTTTTATAPTTTTTLSGETTTTGPGGTTGTSTTTPTVPQPAPEPCFSWVYKMTFPLASSASFTSSFADDRDGGTRRHEGADLIAPTLTPVLAVADGTIGAIHKTPPDDCCWLLVTHQDGWQSLYVHLNNDLHLTDDGNGYGVPTDLSVGDSVVAGQVIGWVGDSGNAEGSVPHLHFELRHPSGYSVDPYSSLRAAASQAELPDFFGAYRDDDDTPLPNAERLLTAGGFWGCDESGLDLCPLKLAGSEDTGVLLGRLFGLEFPAVPERQQTIVFQRMFSGRNLDQAIGCRPIDSCLQNGITAGDLARLVDWAQRVLLLEEMPTDPRLTIPVYADTQAETNLRFFGTIASCDHALDKDRLVTRAEVIDLIARWLLDPASTRCGQPASTDI